MLPTAPSANSEEPTEFAARSSAVRLSSATLLLFTEFAASLTRVTFPSLIFAVSTAEPWMFSAATALSASWPLVTASLASSTVPTFPAPMFKALNRPLTSPPKMVSWVRPTPSILPGAMAAPFAMSLSLMAPASISSPWMQSVQSRFALSTPPVTVAPALKLPAPSTVRSPAW